MKKNIATILPLITGWSESREKQILANGKRLSAKNVAYAKQVGVQYPQKIRIIETESIPLFEHPILQEIYQRGNVKSKRLTSAIAGYGILIRKSWGDSFTTLITALMFVRQYEYFGGIRPLQEEYLCQLFKYGYSKTPLDREARCKANEFLKLRKEKQLRLFKEQDFVNSWLKEAP